MNAPALDRELEALLDYLWRSRGFDFSGYKRPTLARRISRRMQAVGCGSYAEYTDYLEVHPDEFGLLFDTILINVTAFYRDPPVWDYLQEHVLPRIVGKGDAADPIRIWSAGCASGQEAYTVAALLVGMLSPEQFQQRVKIYATDLDEGALAQARAGGYTAREIEELPAALREASFERAGSRYVFHKDLRRSIIFGRHDLLTDAPISRLDLLLCRNVLMYFNSEHQARILARFNAALKEDGFLVLGKAETLLTHGDLFVPVDLKHRAFRKVPRTSLRDRLLVLAGTGNHDTLLALAERPPFLDVAWDAGPVAQVAVDVEGALRLANARARGLFALTARDIGRPLQDVELSYRPVELRSLIEQALETRQATGREEVPWTTPTGEAIWLNVAVTPLAGVDGGSLGALVTFTDITQHRQLEQQLQQYNEALETAYEELQATSEELETTNEELQSTNEELETTNEELQSTNEELETMNEELQSANHELQAITDEIQLRSEEVTRVNAFLVSILGSLAAAVVVVDRELCVQAWNPAAEDLWGVRAEEALGRHLLNLDVGLSLERLAPLTRACLAGEAARQEITLPATNRRGKSIQCRITCAALRDGKREIAGAILLMEE